MTCLAPRGFSRIVAMRHFCTIAAAVALLTSFFEASYFHLHRNRASDHAKTHHLGQGLTPHAHLFMPLHRPGPFLVMESSAGSGDADAIYLVQTSTQPQLFSFLVVCPQETTRVAPPDPGADFLRLPPSHSHDPPFVPSSAPRSPPA